MATKVARRAKKSQSVGLLANGSSGPWEVAIDQTTSRPDHWFAQIEGPSIYLYFEIPSLKTIELAASFLGENGTVTSLRNGTLTVGVDKQSTMKLVRDEEFHDRFFLVVEQKSGLNFRLTLAGSDLAHLAAAFRQVLDELRDAS